MNDIKFGVQLGTFAGETDTPCYEKVDYNTLKHITLESEKLGYNSVWAADHLILGKDNATLECWTTLTALAAVTKTIRIGSLVLCNSYRYPSILGKMSSTLDLISNGRLDLGIGAGWLKKEYDAYGIPWNKYHVRFEQMREGIEVLKKLWTEECATYIGKHYQLKDAFCEPKPVQKPHPPIWIGGQEEKVMLRLVAELADGWNLTGTPSVEKYREKLNVLKKHCLDIGRPFENIAKSWDGHVIISKKEKDLNDKIKRFMEVQVSFPLYFDEKKPTIKEYKKHVIAGTPDECIERVQEYVDIGVTQFMLWFLDLPSIEGIRLFADHVIPTF